MTILITAAKETIRGLALRLVYHFPHRRGTIVSSESIPFTSIVNVAQLRDTFEERKYPFNRSSQL